MIPSPKHITSLKPMEVFVFGSNLAGRHGKGAARIARQFFDAEQGVGAGITGRCFAIPTKDRNLKTLPLDLIQPHVHAMCFAAETNPDMTFLVTEVGCGLAVYTPEQMAPLFKYAANIRNIRLPLSFIRVLGINENKP